MKLTDLNIKVHIESEVSNAKRTYGHFNSTHEVYGVLIEEVEEFWAEVKKKPDDTNVTSMIKELIQIAAIAQRAANELNNNQINHV